MVETLTWLCERVNLIWFGGGYEHLESLLHCTVTSREVCMNMMNRDSKFCVKLTTPVNFSVYECPIICVI